MTSSAAPPLRLALSDAIGTKKRQGRALMTTAITDSHQLRPGARDAHPKAPLGKASI
jgi:hypothetical protein